jgi:methionyl-tRNA formyltransferase
MKVLVSSLEFRHSIEASRFRSSNLISALEPKMADPTHIIFAGSGEFGAPTLRALISAGHQIVQVFTQPDRPAGRGKKLAATPIGGLAMELGLPVTRTANINAEPLPPADLMVVIAFGQKIAPAVVNHPRLGSVNLHSSRLPKYRGAAPINWAVINGDSITGNSIIRLAEKMDAGAILAQSEVAIGDDETAGELHDRLATDGPPLMLRLIDQLNTGTAIETQQDHAQASIAPKLSRQTAQIDWNRPASVITRLINGLSPWPGCRAQLMDGAEQIAVVTLLRAKPGNAKSGGNPGELNEDGSVTAGDGLTVEILEIQPEGKRRMPLKDFRNSRPWRAGMQLISIVQP